MWINHVFMGFLGLAFGLSVASGSFAIAVKLGIIPEMASKSGTANRIITYENATILGGIAGNILSVFTQIRFPAGRIFLALFGLSAGIFVGCMAVALAEIINAYPIVYRRMKLKMGLEWMVATIAVGKMCGCLFYFINGYKGGA
ncbi:hypothetical protein C823_003534 [Eubacterium plexicaudatum ASF492]|uniref:Stage V sporulation protein AB n=1 Tax=Eubacterium plexicaudatum ASF492 TaxID=1235802 RepID=N2AK72_9FIRM|nr:hypothetical protein C823_003534 [Eubacterium plexicaudatum ASF492]